MSAATVSRPSVNRLAASLVEHLIRDAEALRIDVEHDAAGAVVIDAGSDCRGGSSRRSPSP